MTTISLTCNCGKGLKASTNLAGKRGKCPRCGDIFLVPKPAAFAHLGEAVAAPALWPGTFPAPSAIASKGADSTTGANPQARRFPVFAAAGSVILVVLFLAIWLRWTQVDVLAGFGLLIWAIAAVFRFVRRLERRFGGGGIVVPLGTAGLVLVLMRVLALPLVSGNEIEGLFLGIVVGIAVIAPHVGLLLSIAGVTRNSGRVEGVCGVVAWAVLTVVGVALR